ncbi:sialic acid-binding lectin-like [Tachysurus vachellii]|uniref:sialic acid-binding lectin-like n=1 Tax=Tachysurus vachellii TaxID=175792 RepID=UPI00296ADBE6|nr:sialic acid-binding lectin-like [Tachysurus vachellii]
MEIRVFGLVLLLVLSIALPAEAQTWEDFQRKHILQGMRASECNTAIGSRGVNVGNTCKRRNSFIMATSDQVRAICLNAGRRLGGNRYESLYRFPVVTCTTRRHSRPCEYSGLQRPRYITVTCEHRLPVHYHSERS